MSTVFLHSPVIPPIVSQMIKIGEESGSVAKVLDGVARFLPIGSGKHHAQHDLFDRTDPYRISRYRCRDYGGGYSHADLRYCWEVVGGYSSKNGMKDWLFWK
jgi:hypothetical protein